MEPLFKSILKKAATIVVVEHNGVNKTATTVVVETFFSLKNKGEGDGDREGRRKRRQHLGGGEDQEEDCGF